MISSDRRARLLLRLGLNTLGGWLTLSSHLSSRFRSQVTRGVTIELGSDDGVRRRFVFDAATRKVSFRANSTGRADCALFFRSAELALEVMGSKAGPRAMLAGLADGDVRLEGNPALFGWFQGLARAALPSRGTRVPLPDPYVRPDRSAPRASLITVEPAVSGLDPSWTGAAGAREQLAIWRAASGAQLPRG